MPEHCICPNLDPMEQYRRLLWPLSGKALEDYTSLQFQALEWIANTDIHGAMESSQVIQERYSATLLYFAFRGKSWHDRSSFLSNGNVGQWNTENAGIQCNESNQVTSIRLSNNHLQGKIPSEIKVFSSLGILDLKSNDISGSLPASLLHLPLLRRADLSHNAIVGELPVSIVNATSLESLILRENSLNGTLPSPIGQSTALKDLDLFLVGNEVSGSLNFLCAPDR